METIKATMKSPANMFKVVSKDPVFFITISYTDGPTTPANPQQERINPWMAPNCFVPNKSPRNAGKVAKPPPYIVITVNKTNKKAISDAILGKKKKANV